ncbi:MULTISPECIES: 3-hydroxyacyl-CoA dehydrogenase family protein [Streptomyces]|uniref:3-hydroxyacyl-CoA dehydrogenase family protein n=1 Tax=Streptomyces TaxID=1883 RepID=UPI00224CB8C5|nr:MULTISPECIES: 3-hydroxyacyl-CoA dehydrogenase family protein [Streptomyces]MCX5059170.1 3-hydroxyacyl-CoA dehydrogenase family protein [Streptomyces sp. NBC_00452]WSD90559.1 3-hydroxyacyl-CoA dehydrogenase family protein [Streptomyces canus]
MEFKTLAIVGLGTMGAGIAQTAVSLGFDVVGVERDEQAVVAGRARVAAGLAKFVEKGKFTGEQAAQALARLRTSTDRADIAGADIVIDAAFEDVDLKRELFRDFERHASATAVLASNTSTIPLVIMAAETSAPERVVGLHFFNPVPLMDLVEVIRTPATSEETVRAAVDLSKALGKSPVIIKDVPGFIGNLLVVPFLLDAIRAFERGVASMEDIDSVLRLGFNHPMGPFRLSDLIGLDIVQDMAERMYEEYRDPKYWPPPLLKQYVRMGWLGRKTKRGFYTYD